MRTIITLLILSFVLQSCQNKTKETYQPTTSLTKKQELKSIKETQDILKTSKPTDEIVEEFYQAIFDNNNKKVIQMLKTKFPADYEPKNKISPLQALIWTSDNLDLAKQFIDGGANINSQENPIVVIASEYGRLEILKYLVEKNCDIKNTEAFNTAGFHQFYDCGKFLLLSGANQEKGDIRGKLWIFEQAVIKSDYEVLNSLNLSKDEINNNNCEGETALIIAIKNNNIEMVKYLNKKNVNKNKPETFDCGDDISYGKTPIQIAKNKKFKEIVSLLEY